MTNSELQAVEDGIRGGRLDQIVHVLSVREGLGAAEISDVLEYAQAPGWDLEDEYRRRCQVRCTLNALANAGRVRRAGRREYLQPEGTLGSEYLWFLA
jgi:hypothetical protein